MFLSALKNFCLAASFAIALLPGGAAATDTVTGKTNHLMAIGICPPWKSVDTGACDRSVGAMTTALTARLGIQQSNVTSLVNAAATNAGLQAAFAELGALGPNDRLIIYANLHSGAIDPAAEAGPDNDVFVLWTQDRPAAVPFAIAEGDWIMASDFAGWVHALAAGEVILILDACESGAVSPLFIHAHPQNDEDRPEAVIVSASADQFANFTADQSIALFTQQLAQTIADGRGTLAQAADLAASQTHAAALPICALQTAAMLAAGIDPLSCQQQPVTHDPDALLSQITLQN